MAAAGTVAAAGSGRRRGGGSGGCTCCARVCGEERACAWVGDVCVRMRECGVGSNRGDSPARPPPAQRRAILLAMARRTARHWQCGAHTAQLCTPPDSPWGPAGGLVLLKASSWDKLRDVHAPFFTCEQSTNKTEHACGSEHWSFMPASTKQFSGTIGQFSTI